MGLFENKKKVCPICRKPTPRSFPAKIENMPICEECNDKIDLPADVMNRMSLESIRQYLDFYDHNMALRNIFAENYKMHFKGVGSCLLLDTVNRLFRLKGSPSSLVMEATDLKSFCILEDNVPLFEGEGDILRCHSSGVPAFIESLARQITQFRMRMEMYEQLEHMEESSTFDAKVPFKHFYVELMLTHPYWSGFRGKLDAPVIDRYNPSIDAYMQAYQEKVDQLYTLAVNLMLLINPDAQEVRDAAVQTTSADDTINEIQKYKALLDSGIITKQEFAAKKRQLLGI